MDLKNISQEQVENAVNKYIHIRNTIGLILFFIILIFIAIAFFTQDKSEEPAPEPAPAEPVKLTASEEILWNLFQGEGKKTGYIDASNLDSMDIVSIQDYGKYTKSNPDLRYEQINFIYTCKDESTDCVKVSPKNGGKDYHSQLVTIDLRDQTYIKIGGLQFGMDEQFVDVTEPFTYYDLEA